MERPKLLIISPTWNPVFWGGKRALAPPLVLPLLAGLTPQDVEVQLIDENVQEVDIGAEVNWVAISCMTASAPRAYETADAFRQRGIPVVMGGIHPTVLPDEAGLHADAVVIGEAEPVWGQVIADLRGGRLKSRYKQEKFCDMVGLPIPRRDLLQGDCYLTVNMVQTGRGCPNNCSFCSVSAVNGRPYRFRPIPEVIEEIRSTRGWIGFIDDNITGNPSRAKELFEALIPLKLRWVGQADLRMAKDPELLRLAALSGCHALFVGIESVSPENLRATHKMPNLGLDMSAAIQAIQKAGIAVIGSFVLGLDEDGPDVFARTLEFAMQNRLAVAQFSVLTPFPGTRMYDQLKSEGRIFDSDWSHYTMSKVVYHPLHMSPEQLEAGQAWVYRQFYSFPSILKRCFTARPRLGLRLLVNLAYRGVRGGGGLPSALPKHQDGY